MNNIQATGAVNIDAREQDYPKLPEGWTTTMTPDPEGTPYTWFDEDQMRAYVDADRKARQLPACNFCLGQAAEARAALASRSEAPASRPNAAGQEQGWLPIATAPKDGRAVLIANDSPGSVHPREGYYMAPEHRYENEPKHAGWWRLAGSCEERVHGRTPTHWMPLPTPPLEAVGSSGMTADQAQGDKA